MGKATYNSAFIPDLFTRNWPPRNLLQCRPFKWTVTEKKFDDIKNILISPQVLMLYNPTKPLLLTTGLNKIDLGAVLSHKLDNGQERPVAFAS